MKYKDTQLFASEMDQQDPLRSFRREFYIPQLPAGGDKIYFTGNSLGLQPIRTAAYIQAELDDWATLGVDAHFEGTNSWLSYHELFPSLLAPIVGALPQEIVVMNQLTVNLHLLMVSFYRPKPGRFKIICEARAFPSDQYALETQVRFHGYDPGEAIIEVAPRDGEFTLRQEDIEAVIEQHGSSVALVMFGGINYYTGQLFDIAKITQAAHRVGAIAGFDLAHAAGNAALNLHDWQVDFACWCSYKYLNSGPGGVAGIFVHSNHIENKELPRFAGWWGNRKETRFRMEKGFDPIPTAEGWQLSNAPVISMAVHRASLDVFASAGIENLHKKRESLNGFLHFVLGEIDPSVLTVITPSDANQRGCQVSMLLQKNGRKIFNRLTEAGIVADWREPDVMRVAPVPLYNSYTDVWKFGQVLKQVIAEINSY